MMRLNAIIIEAMKPLTANGYSVSVKQESHYIVFEIQKDCRRIVIQVDFREQATYFLMKEGTTVLLSIENLEICDCTELLGVEELLHNLKLEQTKANNSFSGIGKRSVQAILNSFVVFIMQNDHR